MRRPPSRESKSLDLDLELAFRIAKDKLEIRPIWHQKTDRVKSHILVCILEYALWKDLELQALVEKSTMTSSSCGGS